MMTFFFSLFKKKKAGASGKLQNLFCTHLSPSAELKPTHQTITSEYISRIGQRSPHTSLAQQAFRLRELIFKVLSGLHGVQSDFGR